MNAMLGNRTPAQIVGTVVLVAIMLFTAIEAMRLLGFMTLATMLAGVLTLMGMIALGLVIFGIGVYLSNLATMRSAAVAAARPNCSPSRLALRSSCWPVRWRCGRWGWPMRLLTWPSD